MLKGYVPERYFLFLLEKMKLMAASKLDKFLTKIRALVKDFKEFTVNVNGTQSIEKAFVTGGGVSVKEINPKEMSSKFTNGLYFCGEVLDIHGYTGGYNITSALVTGRIAGTTAGENAKMQY